LPIFRGLFIGLHDLVVLHNILPRLGLFVRLVGYAGFHCGTALRTALVHPTAGKPRFWG